MQAAKPKSRDHKRKPSMRVKTGGGRDDSLDKINSAIVGNHLKTLTDHRGFAGSLLTVPRHDSRERDQKNAELKRLLQKKAAGLDTEDRGYRPPSKLFSQIKRSKLTSLTQASQLDKSYHHRSASKELLSKVKQLFGTKSTEKGKAKAKKSREKKALGKQEDPTWQQLRGNSNGKSRDASRASRSSQESNKSREKSKAAQRKLSLFYDRLCEVVNNRHESHDDKIATISKMFVEYNRLLEHLDNDGRKGQSLEEKVLRNKILGFFSFYCKMNTKAYLYTRKLVSDSLSHIEKFIVKERDAIQQFTPQYFNNIESVDMEEAVRLVVDFAATMVEQNYLLSGYIRKNLKKTEADELLLRKNKPAILKSLMPANKAFDHINNQSDSSMSNMEKENDLNQLYDLSSTQKGPLDFEIEEAANQLVKTYGKKYDDIDHSKTPVTSKLGYYNNPEADLVESNDYEYSETSKKKTINALGRKNSKILEMSSHDKHGNSKEKKSIPPKSTKDSWPKRDFDSSNKLDEASVSNLMDHQSQSKTKHPPAADLRLKLNQIKMG